MANFVTANIEENEVLKAVDLSTGYDSTVKNVTKALESIFDPENNFVIGGTVSAGSGLTFNLSPVFGVIKINGESIPFLETEETTNIVDGVIAGGSSDRRDIICIQCEEITTDEQQRAMIDFDTNTKTIATIKTKKQWKINVRMFQNESESATPPAIPDGWIKIAEVEVPSGATSTEDMTIYNITADVPNMDNQGWLADKQATYNVGRISDVNARFRVKHNADGSHKADSIGKNEINYNGTDGNTITGNELKAGGTIDVSDVSSQTGTILEMLRLLASKITDLYTPYLSNGAFVNKGETTITNSTDLTKSISIGVNADGTAYLKSGDTQILTITTTGLFRAKTGYTPSNTLDFVTKAITDGLDSRLTQAETNITNMEQRFNGTQEFANGVLGRYVYKGYVRVATTANINLSGTQTIDTVAVQVNDIVLVKNQTDKKQNGIWQVQTGAWNRAAGYTDSTGFIHKLIYATAGSQAGKFYYINNETLAVGTDNIEFIESMFSSSAFAGKAVIRDANNNICANLCGKANQLQSTGGPVVCSECNNELNIYVSGTSWINYRGNSSTLQIGNGAGNGTLGTLKAATFCGNLCGTATSAAKVKCAGTGYDICFDTAGLQSNAAWLWGWGQSSNACKQELYAVACLCVKYATSAGNSTCFAGCSFACACAAIRSGLTSCTGTVTGNRVCACCVGGYWGMLGPGGENNYMRVPINGLLPYQAGNAGAGHGYIGTSSWYFAYAYIDNICSSSVFTNASYITCSYNVYHCGNKISTEHIAGCRRMSQTSTDVGYAYGVQLACISCVWSDLHYRNCNGNIVIYRDRWCNGACGTPLPYLFYVAYSDSKYVHIGDYSCYRAGCFCCKGCLSFIISPGEECGLYGVFSSSCSTSTYGSDYWFCNKGCCCCCIDRWLHVNVIKLGGDIPYIN